MSISTLAVVGLLQFAGSALALTSPGLACLSRPGLACAPRPRVLPALRAVNEFDSWRAVRGAQTRDSPGALPLSIDSVTLVLTEFASSDFARTLCKPGSAPVVEHMDAHRMHTPGMCTCTVCTMCTPCMCMRMHHYAVRALLPHYCMPRTTQRAASAACASAPQPRSPKRAPPPNTRAAYRLATVSAPVCLVVSVGSPVSMDALWVQVRPQRTDGRGPRRHLPVSPASRCHARGQAQAGLRPRERGPAARSRGIYIPLGSAPARPLRLRRARLAALGGSALPGVEAGPVGAQPPPRLLELTATAPADFTAVAEAPLWQGPSSRPCASLREP